MSQPPNDDFYKSSTEITELPPQEDFPQQDFIHQPGMGQQTIPPQNPLSQPGFRPEQQSFPSQGSMSQPGFAQQGPQSFSPSQGRGNNNQPGIGQARMPQGPASQPGFAQPDYARAMDQRGPGPQNVAPQRLDNQGNIGQQRPSGFPPPSGPISQPGFSSSGQPQQDQYSTQLSPYPGNNPQSGEALTPREQQFNASARQPQQPSVSPWGQQPNSIADWPTVAQTQTPTRPKRSRLMLGVALVGLVLLILGSGTFVLFSPKSNNTSSIPPVKTAISNGNTPGATHPASTPAGNTGVFNSINTPVQGGADWLATITSVKTTTASLIPPNTGKTYLEIHLTLKNTSSKTLTVISIIEFTLIDISGHRYNETATDTNIRRPPDGNMKANQTLSAQLAYEVPTTQHTFILTFAYGLSSNSNGSIAWKFTA